MYVSTIDPGNNSAVVIQIITWSMLLSIQEDYSLNHMARAEGDHLPKNLLFGSLNDDLRMEPRRRGDRGETCEHDYYHDITHLFYMLDVWQWV